LKGS
jgi:hypothetical protein